MLYCHRCGLDQLAQALISVHYTSAHLRIVLGIGAVQERCGGPRVHESWTSFMESFFLGGLLQGTLSSFYLLVQCLSWHIKVGNMAVALVCN